MPYRVDGALVHATSGNELSRVRTEIRLILPSLSAMPTRVESRHCYAIKFDLASSTTPVMPYTTDRVELPSSPAQHLGLLMNEREQEPCSRFAVSARSYTSSVGALHCTPTLPLRRLTRSGNLRVRGPSRPMARLSIFK